MKAWCSCTCTRIRRCVKHHKGLMQHFATNPQFHLIPDYRATMLYDDKIEQLRQLSKYMPQTRLFKFACNGARVLETNAA
jgi:hypothetical protein